LKRNYGTACPKAWWYLVSPCDVLIKGVQNYFIFLFFIFPTISTVKISGKIYFHCKTEKKKKKNCQKDKMQGMGKW
jgi:hypothetical protein